MSAGNTTIVIGGGANGLTAAALLARHGSVVLLERRPRTGGLCRGLEFHPGYRGCGLLHDPGRLRPWVARALDLQRHGLRRVDGERTVFASPAGETLSHTLDPAAMAAELDARRTGEARRYADFRRRLGVYRGVLGGFVDRPPLDLIHPERNAAVDALRRLVDVRRLGSTRMMELLRMPPMSLHDLLGESLTDPLLAAGLALPALAGGFAGPRSPGTAFDYLLHDASYEADIAGGAPALAAALEAAARAAAVEIRTGCEVTAIRLDDRGAVCGVTLDDGSGVEASRILATCPPRHALLDLLPAGALAMPDTAHADEFRTRGTTAFLLLALERAATIPGGDGRATRAIVAENLDAIERAFDVVKYETLPDEPVLDLRLASGDDAAPGTGGVVSVAIHFVPYRGAAQRDPAGETRLAERVLERIEGALPGVTETAIARRLLMPADLEAEYSLDGGQLHHGEHSLDQRLVRPTPACSGYATPVPGLFLGGSGSHPGGGATCAPGALAAARMS